MNENRSQNAVNALLSEYKKTLDELKRAIENLSETDLAVVVDAKTTNPDCRSVQTILAHVISSGYSYCVYIRNFRNDNSPRPEKIIRNQVSEYLEDLDKVLAFTHDTFVNIGDNELEECDNAKKMMTSWGQLYDIEQMMEHAIVHVMRHRRQVEHFIGIMVC